MAITFFDRRNQVLEINPPAGASHLSENGSNWLWAVTAIYIVSFLAFFALGFKPRANEKIFHYLFAIAALVGTIAYFAQASDLAYSVIPQANELSRGATRQIFFAKYVHWVVSFPVVIIALGLVSGIPWASIFFNVALSWVWVLSYLFSAYTSTNYKWGFFVFGTVAYFALAVSTMTDGRSSADRVEISRDYTMLAGFVNLLWFLYVLGFGVSDGGNRIGVTPSFIWFGILDLLLIPAIGFAFVFLSSKWDYSRLNLYFTQYGRVPHSSGVHDKSRHAPAAHV